MGAAAFWIAIAAILIAAGWFRSRREAMKHETIRCIVEKTGEVDEVKLKELFDPHPRGNVHIHPWHPEPGSGYRMMRLFGTLVLFAALGLMIFFAIVYYAGNQTEAVFGIASTIVIASLGIGLFWASRFLTKPPAEGTEREARLEAQTRTEARVEDPG